MEILYRKVSYGSAILFKNFLKTDFFFFNQNIINEKAISLDVKGTGFRVLTPGL